jgi:hypothetical protein
MDKSQIKSEITDNIQPSHGNGEEEKLFLLEVMTKDLYGDWRKL